MKTLFLRCEQVWMSFQDYSWIQDFEADFLESQPQNVELGRL